MGGGTGGRLSPGGGEGHKASIAKGYAMTTPPNPPIARGENGYVTPWWWMG